MPTTSNRYTQNSRTKGDVNTTKTRRNQVQSMEYMKGTGKTRQEQYKFTLRLLRPSKAIPNVVRSICLVVSAKREDTRYIYTNVERSHVP